MQNSGSTVPGSVPRRRLLDVLDKPQAGIVFIRAPTGFGKSTLLDNWILQGTAAGGLLRLSLSAPIESMAKFWELLGSSFDALTRDVPFASALRQQPLSIVIDGYEHLTAIGLEFDQAMLSAVDANPALRLVIAGRSGGSLIDPTLLLRGSTRELGARELALTLEEIRALFAMHVPHADGSVADTVLRETNGFPLAVRSMLLGLSSLGRLPMTHGVRWRPVLLRDLKARLRNPELVKFFTLTCVPPYFGATLARKLAKTSLEQVDSFIADLEANGFGRWNPFVSGHAVFQYEESLRTLFRNDLRQAHPKQYRRANLHSAKWLHALGDDGLAVEHAVASRDYEACTTIVYTLLTTTPESYLTDSLSRQLRKIPARDLQDHPILAFALGVAYANNPLTLASAQPLLELAARLLLPPNDAEGNAGTSFVMQSLRCVALRTLGRHQESGEAALQALAELEGLSAADYEELADFAALARRHLSYSLLQAGLPDEAGTAINAAVAAAVASPTINYTLSIAAGIHAFSGNNANARHAVEMMRPDGWPRSHADSYLNVFGTTASAVLHLDDGDFAAAEGTVMSMDANIREMEFWPFTSTVLMHARLGLGEALEESHRMEALLASSSQQPGMGANFGTAALHNMQAILWLAAGRPAKSSAVLKLYDHQPNSLLSPARMLHRILTGNAPAAMQEYSAMINAPGNTVRTRAAMHALAAVASLRLGSEANALKLLRKASTLQESSGVRAHLLFIPEEDRESISGLLKSSRMSGLHSWLSEDLPAPLHNVHLPVALSARESIVLQQLIRLGSVDEISGALFVSPNTIKSQLRSVYRKLHVSSREAAIAKALELDLLN